MPARPEGSPMSNMTYNLLTTLQNKLQAIGAYEKFLKDAEGDETCTKLFKAMQENDRKDIEMLKGELIKHLTEK